MFSNRNIAPFQKFLQRTVIFKEKPVTPEVFVELLLCVSVCPNLLFRD